MKMMTGRSNRTYSQLITFDSLEERFEYLKLSGRIGESTFGFDRYLNQTFYRSPEWKRVRDKVIIRDNGCDMGCEDFPINGRIIVHHMNPITPRQLEEMDLALLNPEFLVCVSEMTHEAIHYGDKRLLPSSLVDRRPGDTILW